MMPPGVLGPPPPPPRLMPPTLGKSFIFSLCKLVNKNNFAQCDRLQSKQSNAACPRNLAMDQERIRSIGIFTSSDQCFAFSSLL